MRSAPLWTCLLLALSAAVAHADVLHLKNGRTMEGEVLERSKGMIRLKVPGGEMSVPESMVARVEERRTPAEEYALRARRTDMTDPRALDGLAHWASRRGLGAQTRHLRAQAQGIRLQRRVDRARASGRAEDFLEVYDWAHHHDLSDEVQRWLLDAALELDPEHPRALAEVRRTTDAREAREREVSAEEVSAEEAEDARVAALEARLEAQRVESRRLQERLEALEHDELESDRAWRSRRRRQRRARRGVIVLPHPRKRHPRDCPEVVVDEGVSAPPPARIRGRKAFPRPPRVNSSPPRVNSSPPRVLHSPPIVR